MLGEIISEIVPHGVVNIISGGNDSGSWLTQHPDVAKISFTGSVRTGKIIKSVCADDLKRVTLELGGNDAAIIRKDCDVQQVVPQIFNFAFANSGQVCCAIKRVYVHEEKYDEFCQAMAIECQKHKFGNGLDPETEFGPLNNKMQFDRVKELLQDAIEHGAKTLCGGLPSENTEGYLFPATVVTNVSDGVRIVDEEQFGPVLPIMSYKDDQEAVKRANNSKFGLGGSVWSKDLSEAASLAGQLECGSSWVNHHLAVLPHLPFGGFKWSGYGREGGKWGLSHLTEPQCVHIKKDVKV
jgi:acyl-CoA reductase-like NAD-dependent aldehyde dehydrogenase